MDVSLLIVNYNSGETTKKAIDKLLEQRDVDFEIIIIDNQSQDNSIELFKAYGDKIKLIANRDNLGYGKANNQGAKSAKGDYLAIMNPDAFFCDNKALSLLKKKMESNPQMGLSGSKIRNPDGRESSLSRTIYPGERYIKNCFNDLPGEIAWVHGAMLFLRRTVFEKIGGFDEDYFLFCEDTDLSFRIREVGFKIGCCDEVAIEHIGAVSYKKGDSYLVKTRKVRGTYLFYKKHYTQKDARKLLRIKYWKSLYRIFTLRLFLLFKRDEVKRDKYRRYRATFDLAREFLKN